MAGHEQHSVLARLGGEAGCLRLATDFYARVAKSTELKLLFPGKSVRCATEEFSAFLIQFLDGDPDKTQYRWWLSLHESHARFQISEKQRQAWLSLMSEALESQVADLELRAALAQFFGVTSAYVVNGGDVKVRDPELAERWEKQHGLDQLIVALTEGRDSDVIALARQAASRRSVFVGILARLMEVRRELLVAFVLESIRSDPLLQKARNNGRNLLHYSAGHSCVEVVHYLLSAGADPNEKDQGGHPPLYRVGGENGAEIVRALVVAGALVDFQSGTSRATALHQAARFGNLPMVNALLECGANPSLKDKSGFTPLDRAKNLRRYEVAARLAELV